MLQSLAITSGTGKTHLLVALGIAAVDAGHKVRCFTAAELIETLYRALAVRFSALEKGILASRESAELSAASEVISER